MIRLALASPEYDRPWVPTPTPVAVTADDIPAPNDLMTALKTLIGCPQLASKRWVWEQYDHMVMADTLGVGRPGKSDAALVRVHGTQKALAVTSDCTPRYCKAEPIVGGRQVVAEAWRNITATGATPLAITDNMNFGNPEKPEIMGQFVGCIEGMREACNALDFPVVSGNVSLYNETNGQAILPTPTIGAVGLLSDYNQAVGLGLKHEGETLVLIGDTKGHLGQSVYIRELHNREDGPPPPVDLARERLNGDFVRDVIISGLVSACHDISDGGILVSVAEMAMGGGIGAEINVDNGDIPAHAWLFGEDQGRYIISTNDPEAVMSKAIAAGVHASKIGQVGGKDLKLSNGEVISVGKLKSQNERWLPEYMGAA